MSRTKISMIIGVIALVWAAGGAYFWFSVDHSAAPRSGMAGIAPSFKLADQVGHSSTLEQIQGGAQTVLVHFWASWCPPCTAEMPRVLELANAFKGRPFKVVLVSLDENWKDAAKILPETMKLPEDVVSLIDPSLKVAEAYGSYQFPESYLVDSRQKIVMKWIGAQDWASPPIHQLIDRIIDTSSERK